MKQKRQGLFKIYKVMVYFSLISGWCTIRPAGVPQTKNSPPQTNKGWGFCSTHPSQENCNGRIETKVQRYCYLLTSVQNNV